ncbi:hypothetical protein [Gordonia soli]|uniref:Uncharacterized protein n=1 Tax=Gordonia soli NBRC 108243 TaxID=1223545 RepID=M0QLV2_9ACTN|nr:hypothetical protein [Gordonia soli]GAC69558.1 hypothetical protein GS4_26_00050 [Gordonia soli NBRC 108243]
MSGVSARRIVAGVCAAAAISGASLVGGVGPAHAVQVKQDSRYTMVWLSPAETQQAAQIGMVRFLDQPGIIEHAGVVVRPDSRFRNQFTRIDGRRVFHVWKQQLVDEAASKPGGQIGVVLDRQRPDLPIGIAQYWPTRSGAVR